MENQGFVCDRCSECCRAHRVPVTRRDVLRLVDEAKAKGLSVKDFVQFASPDTVDMQGEPESFADLREGRAVLILAHEQRQDASACIFLGEFGCSVHARRPSACRAYPFEFRDPGRRHLELHPQVMCPADTGASNTASSSPKEDERARASASEVDERDQQASEHALWLQGWNARQRTRRRLRKLPQTQAEFLVQLLRDV